MSATARSVNLALQEPRSVLIRQPAGATPTTVESPTLATHYHTPDIHRSAAQIIRPYARSVRKTGLDRDLLRCVVDLSDDVLDGVLGELEDARVLEPSGTSGWRFRHELLREVATELVPPSVRRSLRAKVADALVEDTGGDPDWQLVATHYEQAQNTFEAVSAYQRASADARRRGALAEARGYLTHALVQVDKQPPGRARDVREMAVRMERGFLASAAEGPLNRATAVDFEECLRLGGPTFATTKWLARFSPWLVTTSPLGICPAPRGC